MRVRTILVAGCSAALLVTSVAAAKGGHDDDKRDRRDSRGSSAPYVAPAPVAIPVVTTVACAAPAPTDVSYNIKGRVTAVSATGITVRVLKANSAFRTAAGATKSGGLYDPAPTATDLAFLPIGDCTRVKGLRYKGDHGRRKSSRGLSAASCVQLVGTNVRSWKRSGAICVGNRIEAKWKAAPNANVAAGALGAPRKIEVKK